MFIRKLDVLPEDHSVALHQVMGILDLPPEVLCLCFKRLALSSPLGQVASACRFFYNLTASSRFKTVSLNSKHSMKAFADHLLVKDGLLDPALLIRELIIDTQRSPFDHCFYAPWDAVFENDLSSSEASEIEGEEDEVEDNTERQARRVRKDDQQLTHSLLDPLPSEPSCSPSTQSAKLSNDEEQASEQSDDMQSDLEDEGSDRGCDKEADEEWLSSSQELEEENKARTLAREKDAIMEAAAEEEKGGGQSEQEPPDDQEEDKIERRLGQALRRCVNLETFILIGYELQIPKVQPLITALHFLQPYARLTRLEVHAPSFPVPTDGTWDGNELYYHDDFLLGLARSFKGLQVLKIMNAQEKLSTSIFCCECARSWSDLRELVLIGFQPDNTHHSHSNELIFSPSQGIMKFPDIPFPFSDFLRQQKHLERLNINHMYDTYLMTNSRHGHPYRGHQLDLIELPNLSPSTSVTVWPQLTTLKAPLQQCNTLLSVPQPLMRELSVIPSHCNQLWPKFFERLAERASSDDMPTRLQKAKFSLDQKFFDLSTIENLVQGCIEVQELHFIISPSKLTNVVEEILLLISLVLMSTSSLPFRKKRRFNG